MAGFTTSEEIIIALVGPLGAGIDAAQRMSVEILESFGYRVEQIKLSDLLAEVFKLKPEPERDVYLQTRMDAGDNLRSATGNGAALAMLGIHEIARRRDPENDRSAYVLRSLKTPDELTVLRDVYGG